MSRNDYDKVMGYLDELELVLLDVARASGQAELANAYLLKTQKHEEKMAA